MAKDTREAKKFHVEDFDSLRHQIVIVIETSSRLGEIRCRPMLDRSENFMLLLK